MSKRDGGPAFPIWQENMSLGDDAGPGMSLRDYFAGKALVGLMHMSTMFGPDMAPTLPELAEDAYRQADAMLAAREEG